MWSWARKLVYLAEAAGGEPEHVLPERLPVILKRDEPFLAVLLLAHADLPSPKQTSLVAVRLSVVAAETLVTRF